MRTRYDTSVCLHVREVSETIERSFCMKFGIGVDGNSTRVNLILLQNSLKQTVRQCRVKNQRFGEKLCPHLRG
jgi:hypothetical protein